MDDTERRCQFCGEVRPLEAFRRDKSVPSGFRPLCKECRNVRDRERYAEGVKSTWPTREEIEANNAALRAAARARRAEDDVLAEKDGDPPKPVWAAEPEEQETAAPPPPPVTPKPKPKEKSKLWVAPTERDPWADEDHWRDWPDSQC